MTGGVEGSSEQERAVVLEAAGVQKSFGANHVLRDLDLRIARGEVHALLGENGAGKSTFVRVVLGLERPEGGTMSLAGSPYRPRSAADARRAGVVMVPQERTLCAHLTVTENVVLGIEPTAGPGFLRRKDARAIALSALRLVVGDAARIAPDARAGELSVAEQQLVEIARALAQAGVDASGGTSARLLVLDEPTSSLGQDDAARLFSRVHALTRGGLAVLLVTHFLADVREHADRYTVLRDGSVRGHGDPKVVSSTQIVREMLGRELEVEEARRAADAAGPDASEIALEITNLSAPGGPRDVSLVVRRGEIFGVAGLVGSGRTELLRAAVGLDARTDGSVAAHAPRGVGLLSEDRGGEGLMLARSIADNVCLSPRSPALATPASDRAEGERWIARLGIRAPGGSAQKVAELSGGNQQKVQLARLLREDYDVLLVDEPTRGIDVAAKAQVLGLLRELAGERRKAIVLVSSQFDELLSTCDRIAVLKKGRLGPTRPAGAWTPESLLLEAAS